MQGQDMKPWTSNKQTKIFLSYSYFAIAKAMSQKLTTANFFINLIDIRKEFSHELDKTGYRLYNNYIVFRTSFFFFLKNKKKK